MRKMIKLINGPLHGMEWVASADETQIVFLEKSTGKVRLYARSDTAVFVKEWASREEYEEERDNPARTGQLGQDNVNPGDNDPRKG